MLRIISLIITALVVQVFDSASQAYADDFQPLTVRLSELDHASDGWFYQLFMRVPIDSRLNEIPTVQLPKDCQLQSQRRQSDSQSQHLMQRYICAQNLTGQVVQIVYQRGNPGLATLVSFTQAQHTSSTALAAHQNQWQIPIASTPAQTAAQYFNLGFTHLMTGFDHLLFVTCLLLICLRRFKLLLWTITAFTIAHSLTLGLTALGHININVRAVEAIIALSIVYLASDIIKHYGKAHPRYDAQQRAKQSMSFRAPVWVAALFGLLHGLGFANILSQFGLPQNAQLLALLCFNLGIEIGQIAFISVVLALLYLLKRAAVTVIFKPMTPVLVSYAIGGVAMLWTLERVGIVF